MKSSMFSNPFGNLRSSNFSMKPLRLEGSVISPRSDSQRNTSFSQASREEQNARALIGMMRRKHPLLPPKQPVFGDFQGPAPVIQIIQCQCCHNLSNGNQNQALEEAVNKKLHHYYTYTLDNL
jgi:hypothetical protein